MKMNQKKALMIFMIILGSMGLMAQSGFTSTGTDAQGNSGTVSLSVGLIDFLSINGSSGSVNQGIQHPGIIITTGTDFDASYLSWNAYPNPTSQSVTIELSTMPKTPLTVKLHDAKGKLLESLQMTQTKIEVDLETRANGVYLIHVFEKIRKSKILK
jgi:hypothetical protein